MIFLFIMFIVVVGGFKLADKLDTYLYYKQKPDVKAYDDYLDQLTNGHIILYESPGYQAFQAEQAKLKLDEEFNKKLEELLK